MANYDRNDFEVRYELFDRYAVSDQRVYYHKKIDSSDRASSQVNFIRAVIALATGLAAAAAAALAQAYLAGGQACNRDVLNEAANLGTNVTEPCGLIVGSVVALIILSILLPALGGFFSSLADLYQWERLSTIYDSAARNLFVADALSPEPDEEFENYVSSFYAYIEGTLGVMSDETAQWGQAIRTPEQSETFVAEARRRAKELGGDADAWGRIGFADSDDTQSDGQDTPG